MSDLESTFVEPVAPVTTVAPATPEPEAPVTQEPVTPVEGEPKQAAKPEPTDEERAFQKRLGIESRRIRRQVDAEVRAEYAERQLAELKAPPKVEAPSGEPKPEQFQDYETYIKAFVKHEQVESQKQIRNESESSRNQREFDDRARAIAPKLQKAMEKYDDFEEIATTFKMPPPMEAAVLESDIIGDLAHYLGSNRQEVARISALPPTQQVREIAKIEAKLSAVTSKPTNVPAPIVPNSANSSVGKKPSEMSTDEFWEYRRKRLRRK